jgi:hypothetical protein
MTRPLRLFAIVASAIAVAATATAQLVRAEGRQAEVATPPRSRSRRPP